MKAMVMRAFGAPDVMQLEEIETPVPGPGEVLVEVHAVSVNRTLDMIVRAGRYATAPKLPHILGVDPSGVVAAVGEGVTSPRVGDRVTTIALLSAPSPTTPLVVLGVHTWGGYAEYVKVPASCTHPVPDNVDFPTATVVARHAPVAFSLLRDHAKVQPGEWVLVMGASGGLGSAGVQAAKYLGANVIAAAGADERVQAAMSLGADAGVNYRTQDLAAEVLRITGGRGAQVVFENIGDPELFPKAFMSLARFGRLVTAGSHGGGVVPLDVSRLYLYGITVIGSVGAITHADLEISLRAASEGRLKVLVDQLLPLAQAAEAHRIVDARGGTGKVILEPRR